ncbi:MAG: hypothetical protein ACTHK4_18175 [Mycobacteriales bacterium]
MIEASERAWLEAVYAGHPPGPFGHREHLRLAWLALETSDSPTAAAGAVAARNRAIATPHGAPQKYNATVTTAWVKIVDHVRQARAVETFAELLEAAPWLFDKRLLLHHYTSTTLAGRMARESYVPPDLEPLPTSAA